MKILSSAHLVLHLYVSSYCRFLVCFLSLYVHSFSTTLDADSSDRATSLDSWTVDAVTAMNLHKMVACGEVRRLVVNSDSAGDGLGMRPEMVWE